MAVKIILEGLIKLPGTAIHRTVRVFRLVLFTYQLEYRCLNAGILKYDYLSLAVFLVDLCTLFLPHFCPINCQVCVKNGQNESNPCLGLNMPNHNFSNPISSLKSLNILSYPTHGVYHLPLHMKYRSLNSSIYLCWGIW